jgi:hypothetical protein
LHAPLSLHRPGDQEISMTTLTLAEAIRRRFAPLGGADELQSHPPVPVGEPVRLDR